MQFDAMQIRQNTSIIYLCDVFYFWFLLSYMTPQIVSVTGSFLS